MHPFFCWRIVGPQLPVFFIIQRKELLAGAEDPAHHFEQIAGSEQRVVKVDQRLRLSDAVLSGHRRGQLADGELKIVLFRAVMLRT